MNTDFSLGLVDLVKLINAIPPDDIEMLTYYKKKLSALVDDINKDLTKVGIDSLSLEKLLICSPEPNLTLKQ